jgi:hypothetical protein
LGVEEDLVRVVRERLLLVLMKMRLHRRGVLLRQREARHDGKMVLLLLLLLLMALLLLKGGGRHSQVKLVVLAEEVLLLLLLLRRRVLLLLSGGVLPVVRQGRGGAGGRSLGELDLVLPRLDPLAGADGQDRHRRREKVELALRLLAVVPEVQGGKVVVLLLFVVVVDPALVAPAALAVSG